jgi:hypothetical protein
MVSEWHIIYKFFFLYFLCYIVVIIISAQTLSVNSMGR